MAENLAFRGKLVWFGLVWFDLFFDAVVLLSIHIKFELSRCLGCPTIEIYICSIPLIKSGYKHRHPSMDNSTNRRLPFYKQESWKIKFTVAPKACVAKYSTEKNTGHRHTDGIGSSLTLNSVNAVELTNFVSETFYLKPALQV